MSGIVSTPEMIDLLVGLVIPLLVAAVTKIHAPSWAKAVVNLLLSAVTGALTSVLGMAHVDWRSVGMLILTTWVASMASYKGFHQPSGLAAAVAQATRAFGVAFGATIKQAAHPQPVQPQTGPPTLDPPAPPVATKAAARKRRPA